LETILPLIYAHQDYGEHQNIQCKQELQDLKMPNLVQGHHNQHIYHFHKLFATHQSASLHWLAAVVNFSMLVHVKQQGSSQMYIHRQQKDQNQYFQMNYSHWQTDDDRFPGD
jgi:hypothetical protein